MYLNEFKLWLDGYLEAIGIEEVEALAEEELIAIVKKLSEVEEHSVFDFRPMRLFEDPITRFGNLLPQFNHYMEKIMYHDSEGNKYEYTNRDGEEKVKTNIKDADKLTAKARGIVQERLEKKTA